MIFFGTFLRRIFGRIARVPHRTMSRHLVSISLSCGVHFNHLPVVLGAHRITCCIFFPVVSNDVNTCPIDPTEDIKICNSDAKTTKNNNNNKNNNNKNIPTLKPEVESKPNDEESLHHRSTKVQKETRCDHYDTNLLTLDWA